MKINNKKELKRIAEEKSGHLDYKDYVIIVLENHIHSC